MESPMLKFTCVLFLVAVAGITAADAAGECGNNSPDLEAMKLLPCASAAQSDKATPSGTCCDRVKKLGQSPSCLCAVMLSNAAKMSGVKPEVAITIPKRCNLADRPVGFKCGGNWHITIWAASCFKN
ncbi:bifunctional inhibitor/lipid-transfer protein/seed storage 2S albumin superfamily protein [Actinidia rufa]|uniref:Bifunctional inhibitor/lipid-transfer protein/seed storage 2S albumin superfamily protein n=1 Tax=Actinidia rufa TaxID=165716 RepID=A0A7J0E6N2_9ERIC|nr:bifunctional inhibitor/lipid-transfer protein/seed storage 2S albumin superfamily protein [Actinidia rufa]